MSVESEIEALRDDLRSMRAQIDSFFKTFQGDVMSRLGSLEQWQISATVEQKSTQEKIDEMRTKAHTLSSTLAVATVRGEDMTRALASVTALTSQSDQLKGSLSAMRWVGGLIMAALTIAEIVHGFITFKGH